MVVVGWRVFYGRRRRWWWLRRVWRHRPQPRPGAGDGLTYFHGGGARAARSSAAEGAAPTDGAAEASPAASTEEAPAASTPKTPEAPAGRRRHGRGRRLARSPGHVHGDTEGAAVEPQAADQMEDDEEDEEMKLALAMSMQQASSEAPAPAAAAGEFNDPAFVNSMLAQLPGVDPTTQPSRQR